MTYQLARDGRVLGSFSEDQLHAMLAQGSARPDDLLWREGMLDWIPLSAVLGAAPPPRALPPPVPALPPARRVRVWPWVLGGIALLLLLISGLATLAMASYRFSKEAAVKAEENNPDRVSRKPLLEERAGHRTVWQKSSYEAAGPADAPPKGVLELVHYPSPAGKLAAYLTPDPKDGKKHPAIVWAHGGFGGIGSYFWEPASKRNDQSARAFREAGIVMMMPSWRGENDNPGRFELFYGEVEDMIAAIDHVRALPWVDPERVYIGGHSTGGTMTLLSAVASDKFRAAFSFGGMPDGVAMIHDEGGYGNTPFNTHVKEEARLRSPVRYVSFIRRPTFYFEGAKSSYHVEARSMMQRARKAGVPFTAFQLPGDHFDVLHPTTHLIAQKILADMGPQCTIAFTIEELRAHHAAAFSESLGTVLKKWNSQGGSLEKLLNQTDKEDAAPHTVGDMEAAAAAMRKLASQPHSPEVAGSMAMLTQVIQYADEDLIGEYEERVLPTSIAWVRKRMEGVAPFSEAEAGAFVSLLGMMAESEDARCIDLVIEAATRGIGSERYDWASVLSLDGDNEHTERVMRELSRQLPPGFIGACLLQMANSNLIEGMEVPHPFDTAEGEARLRAWLEDKNVEHLDDAHSAAVALAFVGAPRRATLLPVALKHPDANVRMEGAWADAKHGGAEGLALLKTAALDVHQSTTACAYLKEFGKEDQIPAAAHEPTFAATAQMSNWLQYPNELGALPLSLEVFDTREIYWPPLKEKKRVWLFRFTYKFDDAKPVSTGYGMVGGMTWSSFSDYDAPPTPEALYIHHCALELSRDAGNRQDKVENVGEDEAREALNKGNPGMFPK